MKLIEINGRALTGGGEGDQRTTRHQPIQCAFDDPPRAGRVNDGLGSIPVRRVVNDLRDIYLARVVRRHTIFCGEGHALGVMPEQDHLSRLLLFRQSADNEPEGAVAKYTEGLAANAARPAERFKPIRERFGQRRSNR